MRVDTSAGLPGSSPATHLHNLLRQHRAQPDALQTL